ncbi:MAG: RNA polymerase sigma factor [Rhizobiaceae bacterium]|nr:RNA polymerase sigma factor [Rhizobiaceae bacterium]
MTKFLGLLGSFLAMRPLLEARVRRQLGSRTLAEDVLHDSWLKLSAIDDEARIDNPAAYISQTVHNTAIGHLRKETRRAEIDAEVEQILWGSDENTPERTAIARDLLRAVQAELDALPERTRSIFLKNRIDGLSHRLIAQEFGITEEAVYYHIRRALDRLAAIRDQI